MPRRLQISYAPLCPSPQRLGSPPFIPSAHDIHMFLSRASCAVCVHPGDGSRSMTTRSHRRRAARRGAAARGRAGIGAPRRAPPIARPVRSHRRRSVEQPTHARDTHTREHVHAPQRLPCTDPGPCACLLCARRLCASWRGTAARCGSVATIPRAESIYCAFSSDFDACGRMGRGGPWRAARVGAVAAPRPGVRAGAAVQSAWSATPARPSSDDSARRSRVCVRDIGALRWSGGGAPGTDARLADGKNDTRHSCGSCPDAVGRQRSRRDAFRGRKVIRAPHRL